MAQDGKKGKPLDPGLVSQPREPRPPPKHAGDVAGVCSNCQHFDRRTENDRGGKCHNGISGRLTTRAIDGCAYGFYPDVKRFPLKAGPGGIR